MHLRSTKQGQLHIERPQNGQVERYNRTLMDAVRCFIRDSQDQWDLHLQQIAGAR